MKILPRAKANPASLLTAIACTGGGLPGDEVQMLQTQQSHGSKPERFIVPTVLPRWVTFTMSEDMIHL